MRHSPRPRAAMQTVVARIGRHAVRLSCGHVETLSVGEADAVGRKLPCDECTLAGELRDGERGR